MPNNKKAKTKTSSQQKKKNQASVSKISNNVSTRRYRVPAGYGEKISASEAGVRTHSKCERLGSVTGNGAFGISTNIAINPGLDTFLPWLSRMADLYTYYRIHNIRIKYTPAITVFSNGEVMIGWNANTYETPPISDVELTENNGYSTDVLFEAHELNLGSSPVLFIRKAALVNVDLKTYDFGRLFVATNGVAADLLCGHIDVHYDVSFYGKDVGTKTTLHVEDYPQMVVGKVASTTAGSQPDANGAVVLPLFGEAVSNKDVDILSAFPNGGTGTNSTSPVILFNEPGTYQISLKMPVESTNAPTESTLRNPETNFSVNSSLSEDPDIGVFFDKTWASGWEQLRSDATNFFTTVRGSFVRNFTKGEVLRGNTNYGSTINISALANGLLKIEKLAGALFGEIADDLILPQISQDQNRLPAVLTHDQFMQLAPYRAGHNWDSPLNMRFRAVHKDWLLQRSLDRCGKEKKLLSFSEPISTSEPVVQKAVESPGESDYNLINILTGKLPHRTKL